MVAMVPFPTGDPSSLSIPCSPCQGYGDHKPKSSTAAQDVKTLDGIFTEQVSAVPRHGRGQGARAELGVLLSQLAFGLWLSWPF